MKENSESNEDFWANATVICAYTRADALEDGVLVDVSRVALECQYCSHRWRI